MTRIVNVIYLSVEMKKAYSKYLLSLSILLLSLVSQAHKSDILLASKGTLSVADAVANQQKSFATHQVFFAAKYSLETKDKALFDAEEEVEEKEGLETSKRTADVQQHFTSLFYNWYQHYILLNTLQSLPSRKHCLHFSSNKLFIMFRVFRI